MTRPDFTGIRPDVAEYITSLEQDTVQKQQELGLMSAGKTFPS